MPRQNVDYSKTVIYKIVCNDENVDYLYIGSTTDITKRNTLINVLVIMKIKMIIIKRNILKCVKMVDLKISK